MSETDDALAKAIREVANAKIAEALGGDVLDKMITAIMSHRDNSWQSKDNSTMLEKLVNENIRLAIEEVVRDFIKTHHSKVKTAVEDALNRGGVSVFATSIADAFAAGDWRANLMVSIDRKTSD